MPPNDTLSIQHFVHQSLSTVPFIECDQMQHADALWSRKAVNEGLRVHDPKTLGGDPFKTPPAEPSFIHFTLALHRYEPAPMQLLLFSSIDFPQITSNVCPIRV